MPQSVAVLFPPALLRFGFGGEIFFPGPGGKGGPFATMLIIAPFFGLRIMPRWKRFRSTKLLCLLLLRPASYASRPGAIGTILATTSRLKIWCPYGPDYCQNLPVPFLENPRDSCSNSQLCYQGAEVDGVRFRQRQQCHCNEWHPKRGQSLTATPTIDDTITRFTSIH
ncbi:MAG: hypothetical protein CM15mP120_06240 [Pseudomonadota bacterium]|nr:MAG: hypothetical protein CM15mP120_06240 [Pseudomonadota bacterium]